MNSDESTSSKKHKSSKFSDVFAENCVELTTGIEDLKKELKYYKSRYEAIKACSTIQIYDEDGGNKCFYSFWISTEIESSDDELYEKECSGFEMEFEHSFIDGSHVTRGILPVNGGILNCNGHGCNYAVCLEHYIPGAFTHLLWTTGMGTTRQRTISVMFCIDCYQNVHSLRHGIFKKCPNSNCFCRNARPLFAWQLKYK